MENDSNDIEFDPLPQDGSIWPRLWRGMKLRCPRCGQAKLFRSYLKPVEHCSNCNQAWGKVRADLAPAWAAMTIAAHITVLVWHLFFWNTGLPNWQLTSILSIIAVAICLISLPPMKGLFMAIIWAKGTTDS
jgi:uncharacterized protein (DUF983 family)